MAVRGPISTWLGRGFVVVAILVLVFAGAATLAGFNGRQSWRFELFCHFRVQYFWALAMSAGVLLLLRRWIWATAAVALAAANLAVIVPLYFGPEEVPGGGAPVRLLSLNVHAANRNFQPTLELIRRENPDVIFLMEFTPAWADAMRVLDQEYPYSKELPSRATDGVALFSRYPIADLEVKRDPGIRLPTFIAGIDMPQGRMTLLATHPASPGSPEHFEARNIQLAEVAEWAAERSGPVVLAGDLNTTSWSPYFADLLEVSGLRDSRMGYGVEPTWPWFPLPLRIPLDHCLVSPEVRIENRRVGPPVGSDHRPLLVDFSY